MVLTAEPPHQPCAGTHDSQTAGDSHQTEEEEEEEKGEAEEEKGRERRTGKGEGKGGMTLFSVIHACGALFSLIYVFTLHLDGIPSDPLLQAPSPTTLSHSLRRRENPPWPPPHPAGCLPLDSLLLGELPDV